MKLQKKQNGVDLVRIAAVIDFVNETERAMCREHLMQTFAAQWHAEFQARKA